LLIKKGCKLSLVIRPKEILEGISLSKRRRSNGCKRWNVRPIKPYARRRDVERGNATEPAAYMRGDHGARRDKKPRPEGTRAELPHFAAPTLGASIFRSDASRQSNELAVMKSPRQLPLLAGAKSAKPDGEPTLVCC